MAFWGCHPDADVPENHISRHDFGAPRPLSRERLRALETAILAIGHAPVPTATRRGSADTDETPAPAICDWCGETSALYAGSNVCRACYEDFGGPTEPAI